jgi:ribosome maturation factor RimP
VGKVGSEVDRVLKLAEPIADEFGLEVLDVELRGQAPRRLLRVILDSSTPGRAVTLDDCATVSRRLGDVLDANEALSGSYLLEVSSPGINRPLRTLDHFRRVVGERVRVRFRVPCGDVRGLVARLAAVDDEGRLVLESESGSVIEASVDNVEKANLEFSFQVPAKPAGRTKRRKRGGK